MFAESRISGRPAGIAALILLLVLGAVVLANLASFAVTFSGPPPRPAPYRVEEVARALQGGEEPRVGPRVRIVESATPLTPRSGEVSNPEVGARIAAMLHVAPDRVIGAFRNGGVPGFDGGPPHRRGERMIFGGMTVSLRTAAGWRTLQTLPEPLFSPWHRTTLSAMLATILLLAIPGWALARAITRPLAELADAADAARIGGPAAPMPSSGPREVRRLARALDTMRDRLARSYETRAGMLAAIAHDLGTPLTRLAFWVDRLPEAERVRAAADLGEMRTMIAAVLAFARDGASAERFVRLDLGSLLDSLVEDAAATGRPVGLTGAGGRAVVCGDPGALRRLFDNLVENAVRYAGAAEVGWSAGETYVEAQVADRGPGIAADLLPRLFEPFVRGEPSRNRDTGGAGLGLSIVRAIGEAHGATVLLANREGGGTIATVRLPLA